MNLRRLEGHIIKKIQVVNDTNDKGQVIEVEVPRYFVYLESITAIHQDIEQPFTIWSVCDYDSGQVSFLNPTLDGLFILTPQEFFEEVYLGE